MKKIIVYLILFINSFGQESFTALLDNDMFFSDKWYTNGLEFTWDNFDYSNEIYHTKKSYILGQRIYTPTKYYKPVEYIDEYDRPFAGYLYLAYMKEKYKQDGKYTKKAWMFETIGDASLGAKTQRTYHKYLDFRTPLGWASEIENIYGIAYYFENSPFYKEIKLGHDLDFDMRFVNKLHLGNVMLYGGSGLSLRFGNINNSYEFKEESENKLGTIDEYYLTLDSSFELKGHDSTIEGDIFNNESPFTKDIYPVVVKNGAGFYLRWDDFSFDYDLTLVSTELKDMEWKDNNWRYHTLKFSWLY